MTTPIIITRPNNNEPFLIQDDLINEIAPLSGYEPNYEPHKWNDRPNIKHNHNCYSYAFNAISGRRKDKPQPGYFTNIPSVDNNNYKCSEFYIRLKKDNPTLHISRFKKPCKKGYYKAFIAIDPKTEDQDYHFYRQDSSGYWSHKPGRQDVVDYDASKQKIINPATANRNYLHFNYSIPCFFFCLNPKFSRSHSRRSYDLF